MRCIGGVYSKRDRAFIVCHERATGPDRRCDECRIDKAKQDAEFAESRKRFAAQVKEGRA